MAIVNRIADFQDDIAAWRQDLHAHPELLYDVHRTAGFVADKLQAFGCDEVVTGIGRTGVVGVVRGRQAADGRPVKTIGLRADMDALPIQEITNLPYQSKVPGKMHACGHDGHTAMLLGAARYLAETRNFAGDAVLIFQPAEEGGAGAEAMLKDGLMDRFAIDRVYGMHNSPGLPLGKFAIRAGAFMASTDQLYFTIEGVGGHAAKPHKSVDPVLVGAQLVVAMQSVVSRSVDPLDAAVISICQFNAGHTTNVIPQTAHLTGTIRALKPRVRDLLLRRVDEVADGIAKLYGARIDVKHKPGYPVLINPEEQTDVAARIAADVVGNANVEIGAAPMMGAEDFAYMLQARPGAFIFIGNGDSAGLHNPSYNFNDEAIVYGTSYWIRLVETTLAA